MSKVPVNYNQLCGLADHARRVGTLDVFADVALQWAEQADKEIDRLRRQLDEAERDARRYRWLRNDSAGVDEPCVFDNDDANVLLLGDALDASIDAAMGASNE